MEQEPRLGGVFCGPSPKSWEDRKQCCGALVRGVLPLMSPGPGPAGQDLLLYFPSAPHAPNRPKLGWRPMQSGRASLQNDSRSKAEEPWLRRGPQICGFGGDRRSVTSDGAVARPGDGAPLGRTSMCELGAVAHPCATCPIPPAGRRPSVYRCCDFVCDGNGVAHRASHHRRVRCTRSCRSRSCRRPRGA